MLQMRPNCESCNCDLPAQAELAYICSFECTFCHTCSVNSHAMMCPNCKGQLTLRPTRVGLALASNPASTIRVNAPE